MTNRSDNETPQTVEEDIFYSLEPEETEDAPAGSRSPKKPGSRNPLLLLFGVLLSPVEGWKAMKRARLTASEFGWRCFYPLVAVSALTILLDPIYDHDATMPKCITAAIVTFMTYLITNFGTIILCTISPFKVLKRQINTDFGKIYVMTAIASLVLAGILDHILPWISPIIAFSPIYTIYLIMKGLKPLRAPADETGKLTVILSAVIIGLPHLLGFLFSELIQH